MNSHNCLSPYKTSERKNRKGNVKFYFRSIKNGYDDTRSILIKKNNNNGGEI